MNPSLLKTLSGALATLTVVCSLCFGLATLDAFVHERVNGSPEISLGAPKYHWTIEPEADPALVNTHVSLGGVCDLAPGLRCLLEVQADARGKVRVSARWRRPAGDEGKSVVGAHLFGPHAVFEPQAVVISGLAPGTKARLVAEMGVFSRHAGEPAEVRRVFRDDAGLANCKDACLLTLSELKPLEGAVSGVHRALGWGILAFGGAWTFLWICRALGRRHVWSAARAAFGRPGESLALPPR